MSKSPTSHSVKNSINALMRSRNSPSVTMMNGIDRNLMIGATNALTMPMISATNSSDQKLLVTSSQPDEPSNPMPSRMTQAAASATTLVASHPMNFASP